MSMKIDYAHSPAPRFDAVEDVKNYFGGRWDTVSEIMCKVTDPDQFRVLANFAGVRGFPVIPWYELYHGEGAWAQKGGAE